MSLKPVLDGLQSALEAAEALSPALGLLGIPSVSHAAEIASAALAIGNIVQDAISEGHLIADAKDQADLDALIERLKSAANKTAADIEAS